MEQNGVFLHFFLIYSGFTRTKEGFTFLVFVFVVGFRKISKQMLKPSLNSLKEKEEQSIALLQPGKKWVILYLVLFTC